MRIVDLRSESIGSSARVAATVIWEDRDRPPLDIFFETDERFASDLSCDPHAFLVACVAPALRHGERRIAIDAEICPELHDGLRTAMELLQHWTGRRAAPVRIEARSKPRLPTGPEVPRAGGFLSGGVDSLANLRLNRLTYPRDHPRSITDCLTVQGFDIEVEDRGGFELALHSLADVAQDADATLIPIRTNIRHLEMDTHFWIRESYGSALASVAHSLSNRLGSASISSTYELTRLPFLWGSHPLLDLCYGSAGLRIHHDGIRLSRLDKLRIVADWDVALQNLRVCTRVRHPGVLNCGRCEKCVRTMTALLAIDRLGRCGAFAADDVEPSDIARITIATAYRAMAYQDVIRPLETVGRPDLARAIERKVRAYHAWRDGRGWRGALDRLDAEHSSRTVRRIRSLDETRDWRHAARWILDRGRATTARSG